MNCSFILRAIFLITKKLIIFLGFPQENKQFFWELFFVNSSRLFPHVWMKKSECLKGFPLSSPLFLFFFQSHGRFCYVCVAHIEIWRRLLAFADVKFETNSIKLLHSVMWFTFNTSTNDVAISLNKLIYIVVLCIRPRVKKLVRWPKIYSIIAKNWFECVWFSKIFLW